jgi:hypothetical protein
MSPKKKKKKKNIKKQKSSLEIMVWHGDHASSQNAINIWLSLWADELEQMAKEKVLLGSVWWKEPTFNFARHIVKYCAYSSQLEPVQ